MAIPTLTPTITTSGIILPATGTASDVDNGVSFGIYSNAASDLYSTDFLSGAADQVTFVYRRLGGDVLDIELTAHNVYAAYEESVLEYSQIVNLYQGKSVLPNVLGNATGTFDHDGTLKSSQLKTNLSGTHVALKFPKFDFTYERRVSYGISEELGVGGYRPEYSASFTRITNQQDYDLQSIIEYSSSAGLGDFAGKVGKKKIAIKSVYYKTPAAMWRFFGLGYGGANVVGNLSSYGQYADDSTFEMIPVWYHKAQAMSFEDSINVRASHYSFEIKNNKIRIFPKPLNTSPEAFWIKFTIPEDSFGDNASGSADTGLDGINNLNTLPFGNIPYANINAIGKHWCRNYCLALCKEMLGQIRGKFSTIPIPNNDITLNAAELLAQAADEKEKLREELKQILNDTTYKELVKSNAEVAESTNQTMTKIPTFVFTG